MKEELTYYKNSNTGELIMKQHFSDIEIKIKHDYFYDINKKNLEITNLPVGFVEISEKKFNRETKYQNKVL